MTNQSYAWNRFGPTSTQPDRITFAEPETEPQTEADSTPAWAVVTVPGEVIASSITEVPRQSRRVEVGRGGAIQFRDDTTARREAASEVTADTFYVDLNAIATAVKQAQENDGQVTDPSKRVYVGSEGQLLMGSEATGGERIAEVTGDTFYASARLDREAEFVRSNMPRNTVRTTDGTYEGWHFTITNEFGDSYGMFIYYHDSFGVYRVALVSPRMEGTVDAHGTHLWPDGHLCLTTKYGSGYPNMAKTYAKAALWTRGASCYRRGYGFQFNVGQD